MLEIKKFAIFSALGVLGVLAEADMAGPLSQSISKLFSLPQCTL